MSSKKPLCLPELDKWNAYRGCKDAYSPGWRESDYVHQYVTQRREHGQLKGETKYSIAPVCGPRGPRYWTLQKTEFGYGSSGTSYLDKKGTASSMPADFFKTARDALKAARAHCAKNGGLE